MLALLIFICSAISELRIVFKTFYMMSQSSTLVFALLFAQIALIVIA